MMIKADTDPMNEVLPIQINKWPRATFAPTPINHVVKFGPRRETMKAQDLYALPVSEKQHIHPEDATRDQMQKLICVDN